jgi:hypothetical protein
MLYMRFAALQGVVIGSLPAQTAQNWRYFTASDGLVESYVGAVSTGPSQIVWITHGQVASMSQFDGLSFGRLPSPGIDARVEEGPTGELWAMDSLPGRPPTGLKVLSGSSWKSFSLSDIAAPDPDLLISAPGAQRFLPLAAGHVLYLARDGLRDLNSSTGSSRLVRIDGCPIGPLHSLARSTGPGFWIAGERGIGKVPQWAPAADFAACTVASASEHGWSHFSNLFEDADTIFATAREGRNGRVAFRWNGGSAQVLARDAGNRAAICAWSAGHNSAWILRAGQGGQYLSLRTADGAETPATKSKILSGPLTDVSVQPGGVAWIAGSQGLARVAPAVWQPLGPPASPRRGSPQSPKLPNMILSFLD